MPPPHSRPRGQCARAEGGRPRRRTENHNPEAGDGERRDSVKQYTERAWTVLNQAQLDRLRRSEDRTKLREVWLNRLRAEYAVTHPSAASEIREGTAPLPGGWLRNRVRQLGLAELFET
jgi:hypothetical protein